MTSTTKLLAAAAVLTLGFAGPAQAQEAGEPEFESEASEPAAEADDWGAEQAAEPEQSSEASDQADEESDPEPEEEAHHSGEPE